MRATITAVLLACASASFAQESTTRVEPENDPAYLTAVEIVNRRAGAEYPTAIRLLRGLVEKKHPLAADATAYLEWIEADIQASIARRLFEAGQRRRALELLDVALKHEVLGPEARASVEARRAKWKATPVVRPPAVEEEQVTTTAGEKQRRSRTIELQDPVTKKAFYLDLMDPAALRNEPAEETLLDILARGAPAEAGGGATDAMGNLIR